jgi:putative Ig domain-containing protein
VASRRTVFVGLASAAVLATGLGSAGAAGATVDHNQRPSGPSQPLRGLQPAGGATSFASIGLVSVGPTTVAGVTNLTSGALSAVGGIPDGTFGSDDPSTAISPSGTTALVARDNESMLSISNLLTDPGAATPLGFAQFIGEGGVAFNPFTSGVAMSNTSALVTLTEDGVVQLRDTARGWAIDGRVHSAGLSSLHAPHAAGFIAVPPNAAGAAVYSGVAVSRVPLANGEYLGLAIDRDAKSLAVIEGVGTAKPKVVGQLTTSGLGDLDGSSDGNGGMVFSPATATRAVIATPNGVAVLNLTNPAKPKLQSRTVIGAGEDTTSVAISPNGDDVAVGNQASGVIDDLKGLLHTTAGHPLTPNGSVTPDNTNTYTIFGLSFLRNGTLVVNRSGNDVVHSTTGYYLSLVKGFAAGTPHVTQSLQLGGPPDSINSLSVTPALATIAMHPGHLPTAKVGKHLAIKFSVTGGIGTFTFKVSAGHLPAGLKLHGTKITGTPTHAGTKHFTITAVNQYGGAVVSSYKIKVK